MIMKIKTNSIFHTGHLLVRSFANSSTGIKVLAVLLFLFSVQFLFPADVSGQDESLEKIEEYAETLNDLIEKYQKAEIDLIKKEKITIVDTQGSPQDCDVAIFYNNGKQARFRTSGGSFDGNFDHGNELPTLPFSIRLSNCPCRVVSTNHSATWVELTEEIEKIKKVFEDEVTGKAQDEIKEFAEKGVEKIFDKLGYGASASGFLSGFGYGAAIGQPIGDYITESINQTLNAAIARNVELVEIVDYGPYHPSVGNLSPRGRIGNFFGTNPQLINDWRVVTRCGTRNIETDNALWHKIEDPVRTPNRPRIHNPNRDDEERRRIEQEERERERIEREEQRRWEQEQREREREAQRQREEAQRRYEAEQRRIQEKAREIARTCPICDPIRQHIATVTEQISQKEQEIPGLENAVADAEKEVADSEKELQQAQQKLENFNNPDSWVESDGRRITSSDLEVQRELSRENWDRYTNGGQSADETMENWKNQNNPENHERAKERVKQRLEESVKNAEEAVREANENLGQANDNLNRARQELERLNRLKDELERLLEECLEKCRLQAEDIARGHISDYTELLDIEEIVIPESEPIEQPESDSEPEEEPDESPEPEEGPEEDPDTEDETTDESEMEEDPETEEETTDESDPEETPESEEFIGSDYEGQDFTVTKRFSDRWFIYPNFQLDRVRAGAKLDFATRGAFEDAVCDQSGISNCMADNFTPVFVAFSEWEFARFDLSDKGVGVIPVSAGLSYTRSIVESRQDYNFGASGSSSYQVDGSTTINSLELYSHFRRDFSPVLSVPLRPSFSPYIKLGASRVWNSGEFSTIGNGGSLFEKRKHSGLHFNGGIGTDIGFGEKYYSRLNADFTTGGADANFRLGFGVGLRF